MKSILKFFNSFFTFLICTLIYIIEVTLLIILAIHTIFSYRTINTLLKNIEVKEVVENINENDNFMQTIYESAEKVDISEKSINSLLESKEIKTTLAEYLTAGVNFILRNEYNPNIKVDTIVNKAKESFNTILNNNEENITPEKKAARTKLIEEVSNYLTDTLPEVNELTNSIDTSTLKYIRALFNIKTPIILLITIIILTTIVAILKKSYIKWLSYFGITTLFSSFIGLAVAFVPLFDFTNIVPGMPSYILALIKNGIQIICNNFLFFGILYLIISILSFILYFILNKKKKTKKEQ